MPPVIIDDPNKPSDVSPTDAFTLVEMLTSVAVLSFIILLLAGISNQAGMLWSSNERKSRLRAHARVAFEMIGSELQQVAIPIDSSNSKGLQLIVAPSGLPSDILQGGNNNIFWHARIARGADGSSDLAAIGYFIKRTGNKFDLCRFYTPSSDAAFQAYDEEDWIANVIETVAPATAEANYQGLFLENTIGLWVNAYQQSEVGGAIQEVRYMPDTRVDKRLPSRIEVSLAFIDGVGATRIGTEVAADDIEDWVETSVNDAEFLEKLPDRVRENVRTVKINIAFSNR